MKKILVIGSLNMDLVVKVDHNPVTGETIIGSSLDYIPGGKGANQAYTAGKLHSNVTMLGAVGDDANGQVLVNNLKNAGVDTSRILVKKNTPSGTALITVNKEGNNAITVVPGSNGKVTIEDIEDNIDLLEKSDIVVMQMEIPIETVVYVAKKAKEMGKIVFLDPAPVPKEFPYEILPYLDFIKPNETEAAMLTGIKDTLSSYKEAAEKLRKQGVKNVAITLGKEGVYLDSEECGKTKIDAIDVKVVDTTAAGDSFTAAVAFAVSNGKDYKTAVDFANKVSNVTVTKAGAQTSVPTYEEVGEFYGEDPGII